jgi:predicted component of type VI protein secretion system
MVQMNEAYDDKEQEPTQTDEVHVGLFQELLHSKARLEIGYQGKTFEMIPAQRVFVIGRNDENELMADAPTVSRTHARIIFRNGKFILIDQSTNGTFVRANGSDEICLMSEEEFPLSGSGVIGLGEMTVGSNSDHLIHYSCK